MNIAGKIIDEIIKQGLVQTDPVEPTVLRWKANAHEQIEAIIAESAAADTALLDWFEANVDEFRYKYRTALGLRENHAYIGFRFIVAAARRKQEEIARLSA